MCRMITCAAMAAATILALMMSPGAAQQQAQTQRVVGTITAVDGRTLTVKTKGTDVKVNVTDNVAVFGVTKATLADIKPGSFVGVGAQCRSQTAARRRSG